MVSVMLVIRSYKKPPELEKSKYSGTFQIVFDDKLLHSNLYAPENLRITLKSKDSIQISWSFENKELQVGAGVAPEYAILSGFEIYRDGFPYRFVPASERSFVDDKLYPDETYTYAVSPLTFDYKIEGNKGGEVKIMTGSFPLNRVQFPISKIKRYLAEGDSITEAKNVSKGQGYAEKVAALLNVELSNQAITASIAETVDNRLKAEVESFDPDLVTIAVGVNDILGEFKSSDYRDHLRHIIRTINAGRSRDIAILNIFYLPCCREKAIIWDKISRDVANEFGVLYIDVHTPMGEKGGLDLVAGLHPNAGGHQVITDTVYSAIKGIINK